MMARSRTIIWGSIPSDPLAEDFVAERSAGRISFPWSDSVKSGEGGGSSLDLEAAFPSNDCANDISFSIVSESDRIAFSFSSNSAMRIPSSYYKVIPILYLF